jgi:MYXO-CTERM domain-containing protein
LLDYSGSTDSEATVLALLLAMPSLAATLTVSASGTYTTIQSAVTAASDGDTISISAGTYIECVDLGGLDLILIGASTSSTTVDGGGCSAGAFSMTGGETAEISDLTITNSGYSAVVVESSFLTLDNVVIESSGSVSFGRDGGAIFADSSYIEITDSVFDSNGGYYGGAIALESASALVVDDVTFTDNLGQFGAGISLKDASSADITNTTFEGGLVSVTGYGKGGAIYSYYDVEVTIDSSTFTDNDAATFGGAISMESGGSLVITSSIFDSNEILTSLAAPSSGGAIYTYDLDEMSISDSEFTDNVGYFYGGAVFANNMNDETEISDSIFSGNEIQSKRGGAVEFSAGSDLVITRCTFEDNISAEGGAALSVYQNVTLEITESTFSRNTNSSTRDAYGGAIFVYDDDNGEDLTITDSTFDDNEAALSGGALYVYGMDTVDISGTAFRNNAASGVGSSSVYYGGAANFYDVSEVNITNADVCGNEADYAGGFYMELIDAVSMKNSTMVENTAAFEGGSGYILDVTDVVIENNTFIAATGGGLYFGQTAVTFTNNVVAYTTDTYGVYAEDSDTDTDSDFTYNDWYDNGTDDTDGYFSFSTTSDGNITDEPEFNDYSEDGDCTNDDLTPAIGSPLIDAGDPAITDPDDSDSDIGAYGGQGSTAVDEDGDGYYINTDCDDTDSDINPGATEICDGVDNDCDGTVDIGSDDGDTYYADDDGDGFGDADDSSFLCEETSGYVTDDTDCDDGDSDINPDAEEVCDNEDNDCDGDIDGEDATDVTTWYLDYDSDGYGGSAYTETACDQPSGYVADSTDCDDGDSSISPGADEYCDGDDNDCDGDTDEDSALDATTWYIDFDSDGYGVATFTEISCDEPSGFVDNIDDCDDTDSSVSPDADEVCDGIDNNCDGTTDTDAIDLATWYADADGDTYGDPSDSEMTCEPSSGYVDNDDDCDDDSAEALPGGTEICDGLDNDCDGSTDDGSADISMFYADFDGDGYGDPDSLTEACEAPGGHVENGEDCDDGVSYSYPGADEVCDDLDNDCDGEIDEDAIDMLTYYADSDDDGYGDASSVMMSCDPLSGFVLDSSDCNDDADSAYPGGTEIPYDGIDNDCDGSDLTDVDGDGYESDVIGGEDCDDDDDVINPEGDDIAGDGVDQDCDGSDTPLDGSETDDDKGSCSYVGGGDAGLWGLLAVAGLLRRRRRTEA